MAVRYGGTVSGKMTIKSGDELIPAAEFSKFPYGSDSTVTTGDAKGYAGYAYKINPEPGETEMENPANVSFSAYPASGEGTIRMKINVGAVKYHGKYSRETLSPVIYVDNTPPVITLKGDTPQHIELGEPYEELGAEITDNMDPEIQGKLTIDSSKVNTSKPDLQNRHGFGLENIRSIADRYSGCVRNEYADGWFTSSVSLSNRLSDA